MNPKTIFITAFLLFASALCLRAQGTYEYGAVTYNRIGMKYYLGVSMNGSYVETEVKSKFNSKGYFSDLTILVEKVNELAKEDWEVFNTSVINYQGGAVDHLTYHLRRKNP